jgi:heat shock protein HslJ
MHHARILSISAALALAACSSPDSSHHPAGPAPDAKAPAKDEKAAENTAFEGTEWRLVDVGGVAAIQGRGDRPASVAFDREAASVRGTSGLNSFFGPYAVDGAKLRVENLALTKMAGPPELMQQESAFVGALHSARSWNVHGDELELLDEKGAVVARLRAANRVSS